MQDKEVKRVQTERSLEQQKLELKTLRDQLQDSCTAIKQLKDENRALKESINNTKLVETYYFFLRCGPI